MAEICIQKLIRNGWEKDEDMEIVDDSGLTRTDGSVDNDNEYTIWTEWRLDGKVVKRSAHVTLKKNVAAEAVAAMFT
jgi:hypothetical protein